MSSSPPNCSSSSSSSLSPSCSKETSKTNTSAAPNHSELSVSVKDGGNEERRIALSIMNVVCVFSTRCHLNLRKIATQGLHVEYKKENNMLNMKLRKPATTASFWSSGKGTCTGAQTEADAYRAARRYCRILQKMNFKIKLSNYRVVNVLATANLPFQLDVVRLAEQFPKECSYEPELHPGATFKIEELRSTLKLFSTGSVTLTARSVNTAKRSIEHIYPILARFKFDSSPAPTPAASATPIETASESNNQNKTTSEQEPSKTTAPQTQLRTENLDVMQQPTTANSYDHYSHHHHHHNHHNNHHLHYHHYDPWATHHHHHHHHLDMTAISDVGAVGTVVTSSIPLQPPLQPPPATNSSAHHHWFGDNLLIDNALDDFLQ